MPSERSLMTIKRTFTSLEEALRTAQALPEIRRSVGGAGTTGLLNPMICFWVKSRQHWGPAAEGAGVLFYAVFECSAQSFWVPNALHAIQHY